MEIILSNLCESLTGTLNKNHGYSIRQSKDGRFYGKRHSKGHVPPDGHWRFIVDCAQMAQSTLFISDIRVSPQELSEALSEAGLPSSGARHDSAESFSLGAPNENLESLSSGARHDSAESFSSGARHDSAEFLSAADILTLKERMSL